MAQDYIYSEAGENQIGTSIDLATNFFGLALRQSATISTKYELPMIDAWPGRKSVVDCQPWNRISELDTSVV